VAKDYRFEGERGPVSFADVIGDKQTLVTYSHMFGPQRERLCPICTSLRDAWDGEARYFEQRIALAIMPLADRAPRRIQKNAVGAT
jgi:predicted dithiol-disulfide oxidoreductase (DUF899 family)